MFHSRRPVAVLAAGLLSLVLAAPAMAATSGTTDSFTVNSVISISGVPATTSYGALNPGDTSAVQTIDATVSANGAWNLTVTGTDFTGPATISKHQREALLSTTAPGGGGLTFQVTPGPAAWQAFDDATLTDGTADVAGPATGGVNVRLELRVKVPAGTAAGTYSGSVTVTVTAQ